MARNTVAKGQLAAASAAILTGADVGDFSGTLVLNNVEDSQETVYLVLQFADGDSVRIGKIDLMPDESAHVRFAIQSGEVLAAYTTTAESVDYWITSSQFTINALGSDGSGKGVSSLRKMVFGMEQLADSELLDPGQ